jgi:hypothetical protein
MPHRASNKRLYVSFKNFSVLIIAGVCRYMSATLQQADGIDGQGGDAELLFD